MVSVFVPERYTEADAYTITDSAVPEGFGDVCYICGKFCEKLGTVGGRIYGGDGGFAQGFVVKGVGKRLDLCAIRHRQRADDVFLEVGVSAEPKCCSSVAALAGGSVAIIRSIG